MIVFVSVGRLSDFLFMAARHAAASEGKTEKIYRRIEPEIKESKSQSGDA
jgi:cob(I)alamin adenosyltransferase